MIGIDTNLLVRYFVQDDARQVRQVDELIDFARERLRISDIVLSEDPSVVNAAYADYRDGQADSPDYLIGRRHAAAGCEHTVTFDKDLVAHPAFVVL